MNKRERERKRKNPHRRINTIRYIVHTLYTVWIEKTEWNTPKKQLIQPNERKENGEERKGEERERWREKEKKVRRRRRRS